MQKARLLLSAAVVGALSLMATIARRRTIRHADHHCRSRLAGWGHRHGRPAGRSEVERNMGTGGRRRQQAGCCEHHRNRLRRQERPRRIHAGDRRFQPRGALHRVQEAGLRSDQGFRAGRLHPYRAADAGGEPFRAGQQRPGTGGICQGPSGRTELRLQRQGKLAADGGGNVQERDRHGHHGSGIQGQHGGAPGLARRTRLDDLRHDHGHQSATCSPAP